MKRVYFIAPVGLGAPVKIGCSIEPEGRLRTLLSWSPIQLELVATFPGSHEQEKALHHRFAHLALHGEWFGLDGDLAAIIEAAKRGEAPDLTLDVGEPIINRRIASIKSQIVRRIGRAETHALGHRLSYGTGRPAHIRAILDGFAGPHADPPSPAEQQVLAEYVAELRSRPRFRRSFEARWEAWRQYRDGPQGFPTQQVVPS